MSVYEHMHYATSIKLRYPTAEVKSEKNVPIRNYVGLFKNFMTSKSDENID